MEMHNNLDVWAAKALECFDVRLLQMGYPIAEYILTVSKCFVVSKYVQLKNM